MKKISIITILVIAIGAIAYYSLQNQANKNHIDESDYGDPSSKFRYAQDKDLSPYAMFGDSSVVLMTEAERIGKQFIEIFNPDELSEVKKLEFDLKFGRVKFYDKDNVLLKEELLDPEMIARFLSVDPHAEKYASISPYAYVANNPLIFVDPDGKDIILAGTRKQQKQFVRLLSQRTGNKYRVDRNGNVFNKNGRVNAQTNNKKSGRLSQLTENAINGNNNITIGLVDNAPQAGRNGMEFDSYDSGQLDLHDFKVSDRRTQAGQLGHIITERELTPNYQDPANRTNANFQVGHNAGLTEESAIITEMSGGVFNGQQMRQDGQPAANWGVPDANGVQRVESMTITRSYGQENFQMTFGVTFQGNRARINYHDLKSVVAQ